MPNIPLVDNNEFHLYTLSTYCYSHSSELLSSKAMHEKCSSLDLVTFEDHKMPKYIFSRDMKLPHDYKIIKKNQWHDNDQKPH